MINYRNHSWKHVLLSVLLLAALILSPITSVFAQESDLQQQLSDMRATAATLTMKIEDYEGITADQRNALIRAMAMVEGKILLLQVLTSDTPITAEVIVNQDPPTAKIQLVTIDGIQELDVYLSSSLTGESEAVLAERAVEIAAYMFDLDISLLSQGVNVVDSFSVLSVPDTSFLLGAEASETNSLIINIEGNVKDFGGTVTVAPNPEYVGDITGLPTTELTFEYSYEPDVPEASIDVLTIELTDNLIRDISEEIGWRPGEVRDSAFISIQRFANILEVKDYITEFGVTSRTVASFGVYSVIEDIEIFVGTESVSEKMDNDDIVVTNNRIFTLVVYTDQNEVLYLRLKKDPVKDTFSHTISLSVHGQLLGVVFDEGAFSITDSLEQIFGGVAKSLLITDEILVEELEYFMFKNGAGLTISDGDYDMLSRYREISVRGKEDKLPDDCFDEDTTRVAKEIFGNIAPELKYRENPPDLVDVFPHLILPVGGGGRESNCNPGSQIFFPILKTRI